MQPVPACRGPNPKLATPVTNALGGPFKPSFGLSGRPRLRPHLCPPARPGVPWERSGGTCCSLNHQSNLKWKTHPTLCHPERSRGICSFTPPRPDPKDNLPLVEQPNRLQKHLTHNPQALSTQLIHGVLRRMPKRILISVIEIDNVSARHVPLHKRSVIIAH